MSFTGVDAAFAPLRAAVRDLEQTAIAKVRENAMATLELLMSITPVNTGETVRNFTVSTSARGAVKPALGQQPPGPTNQLRIGDEPNRAANEDAARADARATFASFRKLMPIYITNSVDQWGLIESGSAPGAPWVNRGQGGHTGLALAYLRSTGNWK